MKVVPTQRLYFKRFTHCIKLNFSDTKIPKNEYSSRSLTVRSVKAWLKERGVANRTRVDWGYADYKNDRTQVRLVLSVFLNDQSTFNDMVSEYQSNLDWISKPLNDQHQSLLLSNTEIQFRDRLIYKRFRYRILFKGGWHKENVQEIVDWIQAQFVDKEHGRRGEYLLLKGWSPSLYLIDDSDVTLVRLGLGEHIINVLRVDLFSDHGLDPRTLLSTTP